MSLFSANGGMLQPVAFEILHSSAVTAGVDPWSVSHRLWQNLSARKRAQGWRAHRIRAAIMGDNTGRWERHARPKKFCDL